MKLTGRCLSYLRAGPHALAHELARTQWYAPFRERDFVSDSCVGRRRQRLRWKGRQRAIWKRGVGRMGVNRKGLGEGACAEFEVVSSGRTHCMRARWMPLSTVCRTQLRSLSASEQRMRCVRDLVSLPLSLPLSLCSMSARWLSTSRISTCSILLLSTQSFVRWLSRFRLCLCPLPSLTLNAHMRADPAAAAAAAAAARHGSPAVALGHARPEALQGMYLRLRLCVRACEPRGGRINARTHTHAYTRAEEIPR